MFSQLTRRRRRAAIAVTLGLSLVPAFVGTSGAETTTVAPTYFVNEAQLPFDALPGLEARQFSGVLNGAGYRMEVPANWNGELVMWAHGFRGNGLELTVDNPPFRAWLLQHGFAWAASSYQRNGYVPTLGASDTYQLSRHFASTIGVPARTYMTGLSMGGHITALSIETYRDYYAGALPVCGVLGDKELFDYFTDVTLGAEAVTGITSEYPIPLNWSTDIAPQLKWVLTNDPARMQAFAKLVMFRSGGLRPYFDRSIAAWLDFLLTIAQPTPGVPALPAGNKDAVYQLDADPRLTEEEAIINVVVDRVDRLDFPTPEGVGDVGPIAGDITIPVLTMHTIGDLFVPFSMEQAYYRKVASHGKTGLLVQRAIRDIGHCAFSAKEWDRSIADLTGWVRDGVKPTGDDVMTPSVVADPSYGCAYTLDERVFIPACG